MTSILVRSSTGMPALDRDNRVCSGLVTIRRSGGEDDTSIDRAASPHQKLNFEICGACTYIKMLAYV